MAGAGGRGGPEPKNVAKEELQRLLQANLSITEMAQRLGMSRPTLYKLLKKHKLDSAFRFSTNEQIVEVMRSVVRECPQALTDPALMNLRLMNRDIITLAEKRLFSCMRKLQSEMGLSLNT